MLPELLDHRNACIRYRNVELSMLLCNLINHGFDLIETADICCDACRFSTDLLDLLDGGIYIGLISVDVVDYNVEAIAS